MKENVKVTDRTIFPSKKCLKDRGGKKIKLALKTITRKRLLPLKVKEQSLLLYKVGATYYVNKTYCVREEICSNMENATRKRRKNEHWPSRL